jgi:hypothetical protein
MVKKILADGSACRKCQQVEDRLIEAGLLDKIDNIVIADDRDDNSAGMLLAARHQVKQAPFFIVRDDQGNETIHTVYFRFIKEVFNRNASESEAAADIVDNSPDLDYI